MLVELIAVGDAVYVSRVLRGVAMLTDRGTLLSLGMIGAVLGLLVVGIKGVSTQKLDLGPWAMGIILFLVMFGGRADVNVIDKSPAMGRESIQEIRVDDVPIGVAVMGWFVSSASNILAERMMDAFSAPGLTDGLRSSEGTTTRAIEAIAAIRALSDPEKSSQIVGATKQLRVTMMNLEAFMRKCSELEINASPARLASIMQSSNPMDPVNGLGSNDQWIGVDQWRLDNAGTVVSQPKSCKQASEDINTSLSSNGLVDEVKAAIGPMMTLEGREIDETWTVASNLLQSAAQDAYGADAVLSNTVARSMQRYVVSHVVSGALAKTVASNGNDHTMGLNMVLGDAIAQRNSQWVLEESMFLQMARPLAAFFEAMVFICAPFCAFALGLGAFGLQMVLRYGLLTLWVMLWAPTMAAINLFQTTMAEAAFKATANGTGSLVDLGSISGGLQIMEDAESWIAIGSLLMASTPAITLMLLFGSAMTAVGLANRLQSADTIAEKNATPDAMTTGPGLNVQSAFNSTRDGGVSSSGFDAPKFELGAALSAGTSAAQTQTLSASQSYAAGSERTAMTALASDVVKGVEARKADELIGAFTGSRAAKEALADETSGGVRNANEASIAAVAATMLRGGVSGEITAGVVSSLLRSKGGDGKSASGGGGPVAVGGGAEVSSREEVGQRTQAIMETAQRIAAKSEQDAGLRAELQQRGTQALMSIGSDRKTESARVADQDGFKKESRDLAENARRYETLSNAQEEMKTQQAPDLTKVANGLSGLSMDAARNMARAMGIEDKVNWDAGGSPALNVLRAASAEFVGGDWAGQARQIAGALSERMPGNEQVGALLMVLSGQGGKEGYADERANALVSALNASGTTYGVTSAPTQPDAAPGGGLQYGETTRRVEQNTPPPGSTTANAEQTVSQAPNMTTAAQNAGVDQRAVEEAGNTARRFSAPPQGGMVPAREQFDEAVQQNLAADQKSNEENVQNRTAPQAVSQNLKQAMEGMGLLDSSTFFAPFDPAKPADSPLMALMTRANPNIDETLQSRGNTWQMDGQGNYVPHWDGVQGVTPMPNYEEIKQQLMDGQYPGVQANVPEELASVVAAGISAAREQANPSGPERAPNPNNPAEVGDSLFFDETPKRSINFFNEEQSNDIRENAAKLSTGETLIAQGVLSQIDDSGGLGAAGLNLLNNANLPEEAERQVVQNYMQDTGERPFVWRPKPTQE